MAWFDQMLPQALMDAQEFTILAVTVRPSGL